MSSEAARIRNHVWSPAHMLAPVVSDSDVYVARNLGGQHHYSAVALSNPAQTQSLNRCVKRNQVADCLAEHQVPQTQSKNGYHTGGPRPSIHGYELGWS